MKRTHLFIVAALVVTASRKSNAQQITIPASFGLTSSQNQTDWNDIQNAYGNVKIVANHSGCTVKPGLRERTPRRGLFTSRVAPETHEASRSRRPHALGEQEMPDHR
jgi:hypothetical protein